MNNTVLASVIIPAFNAANSIERAIASVEAQTLDDYEILVIDDGSTDRTAAIVSDLALLNARIHLLPSSGNQGVSAARNRGLREATGAWLALLDADDAFAPDRLERLIGAADLADADIVTDNIAYYDWHAGHVTGVTAMAINSTWRQIDPSIFFSNTLTGRSPFDFGQLKPVVRRSFLTRLPVFYMEGVHHGEDFLFLAHLLLEGAAMILLGAPLYLYTERTGSISRDASGMTRTVENCRQMRQNTLELLQHPAIRMDVNLIALLQRRVRAIRWHQSYEKVYHAVKRRDVRDIVAASLRDWRIPILLLSKAVRQFSFKRRA